MAWMLLSDADFNVIAEHQFDWVTFKDQSAAPTPGATEIDLYAKDVAGRSLLFFKDDSGVEIDLAHDTVMVARNETGGELTSGTLVYINGSTGNFPTIAKAQADTGHDRADFVVIETIANNGFGLMAQSYEITTNTLGLNEGDEVYLSPSTPGAWTATEPTMSATTRIQRVGVITKIAASGIVHFEIHPSAYSQHIWHGSVAGLSGDDHTQYLLIDGTRAMTGNLTLDSTSPNITLQAGTNQAGTIIFANDAQSYSMGIATDDGFFIWDITNSTYAFQVVKNPLHKLLLQTTYTALADGATNKHYWTNDIYFIGDNANASMTAGLTINQGAADNEIIGLKSSDVAHGGTHVAETDTFCTLAKTVSTGGISITGLSSGSTGPVIRMLAYNATNFDTTKSTAGRAAFEVISRQMSGAAFADAVADGNIFGVRVGKDGGGPYTVYILDEDGDSWQTGTLCLNSAKDSYTSAHGIVLDLGGTDDLCALQMRDSTDVAHGCTNWCSTNTWGALRKAGATGGGLKLEGYTDGDGTVGIYMQSFVGASIDTTRSTAGNGGVNAIVGEISGAGLAATITSGCNLFAVRKVESGPVYETAFIVGEDGQAWHGSTVTIATNGILFGTGPFIKGTLDNQALNILSASSGDNGPSLQWYGRDHATYAGKMWFTFGGYDDLGWIRFRWVNTAKVYTTLGGFNPGGVFFIGSDVNQTNAKQTIGLTINQNNNDDEAISLKSSDVAHGFTANTETDTWFNITKLSGPYGGAQLRAYAEDDASATGSLSLLGYGGTPDTTKSVSGGSLITIWAGELSGGAIANVTADGNIFGVGARRGGAWERVMILDEDGDLWLYGNLTANGGTPGAYNYLGAVPLFINETANTAMTVGITINSPAATDEFFSLKDSTNVGHGLTGVTETDTFFTLQKAVVGNGGIRMEAVAEDAAIQGVFTLDSYGGTADTTKTTAGLGLVSINVYEINSGAVSNITADGNVLAVRAYVSGALASVMLLDEDGDLWLNGVLTANSAILGSMKSGATQAAAGAAAGELWYTVSHASLPDYVVMMGV